MNATRLAILFIVGSGVLAGFGMWYLMSFAGWAELDALEVGEIQLQANDTGELTPILSENVKGLDTVEDGVRLSGDISFRACFTTPTPLIELMQDYAAMPDPVPLTSPSWFDCYNAQEVGAALEEGEAVAFIGPQNITYGVDRVVAVFPDGRGYVWHQLNACGEAVFAGEDAPEGCPDITEANDA